MAEEKICMKVGTAAAVVEKKNICLLLLDACGRCTLKAGVFPADTIGSRMGAATAAAASSAMTPLTASNSNSEAAARCSQVVAAAATEG